MQRGFREFLGFIAQSIEGFLHQLSERYMKRLLRKYALVAIGAVAALTVAFNGVGLLLGSFFPEWRAGISHVVVGMLLFLAIMAYSRMR